MTYRVNFLKSGREGMGQFIYEIFEGGLPVATYGYDMRDHQHWVTVAGVGTETWSLSENEFIKGGGREPLELTAFAISYLNRLVHRPRS